jgi:ABC-type Fe3+/spermidine/putrescine transport system ATPase subunit
MSKGNQCGGCGYAEDLKGCASHHVEKARKLLTEGKVVEADENLSSLQQHLRDK